jgi:cyclopropane-fatty-acyl-phospholipid synthase
MSFAYSRILESVWLPDRAIRFGVRRLIAQRLRQEAGDSVERQEDAFQRFLDEMRHSPIAVSTDSANTQHYEVPAEFYELVLGRRLKYSCAYWPTGVATLDDAENAMLDLTIGRAGLADGQRVLELGCGWGSLSLYMAERFPASRITAVSNSASQKRYIDARALERNLRNLTVVTADMNHYEPEGAFDRIVSVEMFEHMRNWEALLRKIAGAMHDESRLFVHIFTHQLYAYPFVDAETDDWMARHFFTGGMMPNASLLFHLQDDVRIERRWQLDGSHYTKTAEAWLHNMDRNHKQVGAVFKRVYGERAELFRLYWRVFFMACAELWAYRNGREWTVSHYLIRKR